MNGNGQDGDTTRIKAIRCWLAINAIGHLFRPCVLQEVNEDVLRKKKKKKKRGAEKREKKQGTLGLVCNFFIFKK